MIYISLASTLPKWIAFMIGWIACDLWQTSGQKCWCNVTLEKQHVMTWICYNLCWKIRQYQPYIVTAYKTSLLLQFTWIMSSLESSDDKTHGKRWYNMVNISRALLLWALIRWMIQYLYPIRIRVSSSRRVIELYIKHSTKDTLL